MHHQSQNFSLKNQIIVYLKFLVIKEVFLRKLIERSHDRKRTFTALGDTHPKDAYLIEQKYIEELDCNFPSGALDRLL